MASNNLLIYLRGAKFVSEVMAVRIGYAASAGQKALIGAPVLITYLTTYWTYLKFFKIGNNWY
jgi:hypothetical protein